jgi:hypothetical protein
MIKMRYIKLITCFTLLSGSAWAQTGIGTTAPVNKLEVVTTTADPASSGTAANGNLRLGPSSGSHVMDFGLSSTSTFGWLQMRSKSAYGTFYTLGINPLGGNVGIGTSTPNSTLTVGNAGGTIPGEITLNPTTNAYEGGQLNFKKSLTGSTLDWSIDQYGTTAADARLRIFASSETNGMIIKENGYIGMGNSTPTVRLQVTGDIIANSIAGSSDARFKTNIAPIANPLQKVLALRGVHFNWNTSAFPQRMFSDKRTLGFIAQEVEKVLPEIVQTENTSEGYKSVQYDKVVALLVEAMKEQQKQIKQLQKQVKKLRQKH